MRSGSKLFAVLSLAFVLGSTSFVDATPTFVCQEPGGKRLIEVSGKEISRVADGKAAFRIDSDGFLNDADGKRILIVNDKDVRPGSAPAGVKLAVFDGEGIRHGANGKVMMNYHHPDLCPDFKANRVYSIEGGELSKAQLVAALYLLQPEIFKLTDEEAAEQKKAMAEANAEQERLAAADQVAGKWTILNSNGIMEKLGKGTITVGPKKGDAYPVVFDHTSGQGPSWTGVGAYKELGGDKMFWVAYGTPKTLALAVYEIKDGGVLEGTWFPWYIDGDAKNIGTESLKGPATFEGEYKIVAAKTPATAAAYTGTVTIAPTKLTGYDDCKPYLVTYTIGGAQIKGIGIRSKKFLFVAAGAGPDVNIACYKIQNGTMNSNWYKLGSNESGTGAAMN